MTAPDDTLDFINKINETEKAKEMSFLFQFQFLVYKEKCWKVTISTAKRLVWKTKIKNKITLENLINAVNIVWESFF